MRDFHKRPHNWTHTLKYFSWRDLYLGLLLNDKLFRICVFICYFVLFFIFWVINIVKFGGSDSE